MSEFDFIILTNKHRDALAVPHYIDQDPKIFISKDWEYNSPDGNFYHGNEIGAYRCYMSHIMGLKLIEGDCGLIMEDDCVPNPDMDWKKSLDSAYKLVTEHGFDAACLYLNPDGQHPKEAYSIRKNNSIIINDISWYVATERIWYVGAVCYMISKEAANKIIDMDYNSHRLPIDLLLWQTDILNYAAIYPSPFIHDRSQGSVLEGAT